MEAEPLSCPDNSSTDSPQPPAGVNFPRPDFTEIVQDHPDTPTSDRSEAPLFKPTFKNLLQAKKRLQAFSSTRTGSLPSSPKKTKLNTSLEEKSDEATTPVRKTPKKGASHDDKARAVIEEIEELKREEQEILEMQRHALKRSRSRSRTPDKGRFKKVDKKSRNYRRKSISPKKRESPKKVRESPKKPRETPKKVKRYPRNWREFHESDANFDVNRTFNVATPTGNNELLRPGLFESPPLPIVPFKMKTVDRDEKVVPFEYLRYTRAKPLIPWSVNFAAIKEIYVTKKIAMETLPKVIVANIEALYSNSVKFPVDRSDPKVKRSRSWYAKNWKETNSESSKIFEKSVGLSFLQTYTGEEEEENDLVPTEDEEVIRPAIQEIKTKEEKNAEQDVKKKKSKVKKNETDDTAVDKKKKKKHKEKKKHVEENSAEKSPKKKKREKEGKGKKKEKRVKDKKRKRKKTKEKKKKDKDKLPPEQKPVERLTKEQVIEELKEIEEKLARKREEEKEKKEKDEKNRKRKHSDKEEEAKRPKQDKHRASEEKSVEHPVRRKLEKTRRSEGERKKEKIVKHEEDKLEEVVRKRKSRWSDGVQVKEEFPDFDELKLIEEISKVHDEEDLKETTPDTDEYHSHWESDDDVSSSVPRNSLKLNRSWESDEELFERRHNRDTKPSESYTNLEIPLNIKTFSRRSANWDEKPISVIEELKFLEAERRTLSEERKKLELEKQKILKLQEDAKVENKIEEERPKTPEVVVKVKKEKCEINDFSIDSLNNSLLSTVSSTESNFPIAVLENQYEEFIKAVSSESSNMSKKKPEGTSSDSSSPSSWSSDSDQKKKKRRSKLKKKKKKKKRECEGLLLGKGNDIFNEFDIPVPSDLPEMVPTPVPVPSPILPIDMILPLTAPPLLINPIIEKLEPEIEQPPPQEDGLDLTKPFVFSSIVLPTKKTPLVDNSNLKLDDDSDSTDFTEKFVKKPEVKEDEEAKKEIEEEVVETKAEIVEVKDDALIVREEAIVNLEETKPDEQNQQDAVPIIDDIRNVPLPPEKTTPKDTPVPQAPPPKRSSRSISPRKSVDRKEKRRSRSRSPLKRRSPIHRRELTPLPRRRHVSPRRRSPPRRRGSPYRRSPSPKRRSPSPKRRSPSPRRRSLSPRRRSPRRRRRSPSLSPLPRSRGGLRKRTPSPRRRTSPLNSPLDGFKRSVADSTISDDMLPQPTPDDYNDSPNSYGGVAKYYKLTNKRSSLSPVMSPRRVSLDERISQVLGLEKDAPPPPPPPKPQETFQNYNTFNSSFGQQYNQYGQFIQKTDYVPPPFTPMMYTQPPPPIVKPLPTPTKVLQVGNILQVVPTEEIPPPVVENKTIERCQKIVQVGNMLQIVPAVMPPPPKPIIPEPPPPPPQPVAKPVVVPMPEKPSAEALMKQKTAERKAEREKRRLEREKRRKEKEKKRKEKEKKKQMKLKVKTENMIKRAIQIETEALANDEMEEEPDNADAPIQWPPVPIVISATPTGTNESISKKRKSVQFADGVRPGEGTSPSGGEELSSPPPRKLPKEKRYKKIKIPKKSKKKKVRVKVVKRQPVQEEDDDDEEDNLMPPSPPPGSPPPHVFPSRVKTHTINNVHQFVGNILQSAAGGFPFRPPMPPPVVMNRHQPPPGYMQGAYPQDVNNLPHPGYQGVPSHH